MKSHILSKIIVADAPSITKENPICILFFILLLMSVLSVPEANRINDAQHYCVGKMGDSVNSFDL